jgi:hypothetical protein
MRMNLRPMAWMRRSAVIAALVCVLANVASAAAIAIHTNGTPRFSAVVPDGFEAVRVDYGTDVFAMYRRTSDRVLLVFVRLPRELPQHEDAAPLVAAARVADPFPFRDANVSFHALGFEIPGTFGVHSLLEPRERGDHDENVYRWLAIVPTEGRAFAVLAIASDEEPARHAIDQVLVSVRGASNWRTRAGHVIDVVARTGLTIAMVICVMYAFLLALVFRGKPERAPIARGSLLVVAGIGWMAFSTSWFAQGGFVPGLVGILVAGLGVIMAAQGLGIVRRRRA